MTEDIAVARYPETPLDRCPECRRLVNRDANGARCPFCRAPTFEH